MGFDDIEYASVTDVGVKRSHNQDSHALLPATDEDQWRGRGHVFIVADGMGAHAVGELASKLAVDSIPHIYSKYGQEGPIAALRKAFVEANLTIHTRGQQNREFQGMGTTATALVVRPEGVWIGHVGDSRAYRVRDGAIEQLTFDHSLIWEMARRQHKKPEELEGVPTNVIIRSLGPEPLVQVDVEGPHPVEPGDYFVLCSDGLSGPVTDREIGAVVSNLPPQEACRFLVHLANLQGGPDNITALVLRAGKDSSADPDHRSAPVSPVWGPRPTLSSRFLRRFPWPLVLLFTGIFLALVAIVFTFNNLPPWDFLTFALAALSLVGGLIGLVVQNAGDARHRLAAEDQPPLHVYRQVPCEVDSAVVDKLAHAIGVLEERLRERNWLSDTQGSRRHLDQGQRLLRQGQLPEAFREHCRALLVLMETVEAQRNKEEAFKPLWDRAPVG